MKQIRWIPLVILMLLVDTLLIYGMPLVAGTMELGNTLQVLLLLILFPLLSLFPIGLKGILGRGGVGVLSLNNILVFIAALILMVAVGSDAFELQYQKKTIGGAVNIQPDQHIDPKQLTNTPFVRIEHAKIAHKKGEEFSHFIETVSFNDGSVRRQKKITHHYTTLISHKQPVRLYEEGHTHILTQLYNQDTICGMLITSGDPELPSPDTLQIKPVLEDFETYYDQKQRLFWATAPWLYLIIPLSFLVLIFMGGRR